MKNFGNYGDAYTANYRKSASLRDEFFTAKSFINYTLINFEEHQLYFNFQVPILSEAKELIRVFQV